MRIEQTPLELIDPDPDQPRKAMDDVGLKQLAESIEDLGQLQPVIVVRVGKRYRILDGHQRHAAMTLLGRKEMAAIVLDEVPTDAKRLILQLTANCLRTDLRPIEKAQAFERLKFLNNWTNADLAKNLHISKSAVTISLSHLTHSPEVQAKIDAGEIPPSTAYAISRAPDELARKAMLDSAVAGGLSRSEAADRVKRRGKSEKQTRMVCQLPSGTVTIDTTGEMSLEAIGIMLRKLSDQCRSAAKQGYDIGTLERILADKCRNQVTVATSGSSS
jgi:ParB family chromosome partitioning protein